MIETKKPLTKGGIVFALASAIGLCAPNLTLATKSQPDEASETASTAEDIDQDLDMTAKRKKMERKSKFLQLSHKLSFTGSQLNKEVRQANELIQESLRSYLRGESDEGTLRNCMLLGNKVITIDPEQAATVGGMFAEILRTRKNDFMKVVREVKMEDKLDENLVNDDNEMGRLVYLYRAASRILKTQDQLL